MRSANMAKEIRALTAERGVDPRDYALVAGGGGGPLHAAAIAREFGIADVVVPAFPGLLSAGGLILSDLRIDRLKSFPSRIERDGMVGLQAEVAALTASVVAALEHEGFAGTPHVQVSLDMRYVGQNWDINVPVEADLTAEAITTAFDTRHDQLYGFSLPGRSHEVLSIRAVAVGPTPNATALIPRRKLVDDSLGGDAGDRHPAAPRRWRSVWDDDSATFSTPPSTHGKTCGRECGYEDRRSSKVWTRRYGRQAQATSSLIWEVMSLCRCLRRGLTRTLR